MKAESQTVHYVQVANLQGMELRDHIREHLEVILAAHVIEDAIRGEPNAYLLDGEN